ncbi:MAG: release factor glutamine methyltransferase [Candidatus Poribacteria bacterium]|nr:release factor glutamine methyltransferase [Candidatus Poribacteria bacterium]
MLCLYKLKTTGLKMFVKDILKQSIKLLKDGGIETPQLDAEVLLSYVLNKARSQLYIYPDHVLNKDENSRYRALIDKRLECMPICYLTGHKEFMSLDFNVNRNVLIPRPETELLVETVCKFISNTSLRPSQEGNNAGGKVLDLGTGSGAIAVSLAKYNPNYLVLATDVSMGALFVARENAVHNDVINRVLVIQTDLFYGISPDNKFDWVVSNPPYIPTGDLPSLSEEIRKYEPILALDGGVDGLEVIKRIIKNAFMFLKPSGHLAIEFGYGQSDDVQRIAEETGKYSDYLIVNDYSEIQRFFCCKVKKW